MRKGKKVLALLRIGTITRIRCYTINHERFVYLFEVQIEGETGSGKYHPEDVEEFTEQKR